MVCSGFMKNLVGAAIAVVGLYRPSLGTAFLNLSTNVKTYAASAKAARDTKAARVAANLRQTPAMARIPGTEIGMDDFVLSAFQADNAAAAGTSSPMIKSHSAADFLTKVMEGEYELVDGYAPFCKHIFIENFTDAKSGLVPITEENRSLIESGFTARIEGELPVLRRYILEEKLGGERPAAKYLDIILYSREQLSKEKKAKNMPDTNDQAKPYFIVSIKAQDTAEEIPMEPITMMRNSLIEQGGSGVPIDADKYKASANFFNKNIAVIPSRPKDMEQ